MLISILLLGCAANAGLIYAVESVSERDFSGIADPQLRVGYCMAANISPAEKYLLAETAVRAPDFWMASVVMPHALSGADSERKRAAIRALRERDEIRARAHRISFRVADSCRYREIAWPPEITPLDISLRWARHDSTFAFFMRKVSAEPDAADRVYHELGGPETKSRLTGNRAGSQATRTS